MNDILVGFGVALAVVDIPSESLKQRVDELSPNRRLFIFARKIRFSVEGKRIDQPDDGIGPALFCALPMALLRPDRQMELEIDLD